MECEFCSVVGCYCFDVLLVWFEQPHDVFCQFLGILSMGELSHKQHIGASLHDGEYRSVIAFAHDCVHLKVTETLSIGLLWPLVDAGSVWYVDTFSSDRPAAVLESVAAVLVEITSVPFCPSLSSCRWSHGICTCLVT